MKYENFIKHPIFIDLDNALTSNTTDKETISNIKEAILQTSFVYHRSNILDTWQKMMINKNSFKDIEKLVSNYKENINNYNQEQRVAKLKEEIKDINSQIIKKSFGSTYLL